MIDSAVGELRSQDFLACLPFFIYSFSLAAYVAFASEFLRGMKRSAAATLVAYPKGVSSRRYLCPALPALRCTVGIGATYSGFDFSPSNPA